MDKQKVIALRTALEVTMAEFAKEHGVGFKHGKCRYDANSADFSLVLAETAEGGLVKDKHYTFLEMYRPEWLGKTFQHKGQTMTIIGWNRDAPKYPVLVKEHGGVRRWTEASIKQLLGEPGAADKVAAALAG